MPIWQPVGKPWAEVRTPLVQIAAVSEEQTKNTWSPLLEMLERRRKNEDVQRAHAELGVVRDLLRPLVIDVEDDVLAALKPVEHL